MQVHQQPYLSMLLVCCLVLGGCIANRLRSNQQNLNIVLAPLEKGFKVPPDSIKTSVYWYWMSDNISKEGVVKDLKAMKSVGINRAFIGNIGFPATEYGNVKLFSSEWWDILHIALKTAGELNIDIGIFNSPGWSQSGGPWIKPSQSMRYLASTEALISGGRRIDTLLKKPDPQFQDVRLIAFRAPEAYGTSLVDFHPLVSSVPQIPLLEKLMDKNMSTGISIKDTATVNIDFLTKKDFIARSLVIYPEWYDMSVSAQLQVKQADTFRTVKTFEIDRRKNTLNVGFMPYAPVAISFAETSSRHFRLVLNKSVKSARSLPKYGFKEIVLSAAPRVEYYAEKSLAKMFQAPLPYWQAYQWPQQPIVSDGRVLIDPKGVLDVSQYMSEKGVFNWQVPAGNWLLMRMGMMPTGVTNSPASKEGTGLEVDKLNKQHIEAHFNAFIGEILRRIPAEDRRTFKVTVLDSYETGGQNWTDGLIEKFKTRYGYDPLPYLPVLQGMVVGNQERSDRFLWDLRRLIADRLSYDYMGGLREISHRNGLTTWLENYGHWGFPGEFLQYGGQSDEVAGEFWAEGELGNIENRAASSAAHIYGKIKVSAESFTMGAKAYTQYPATMKKRGDRFFTEGVNNSLLHVYIGQPDERTPGVNATFGAEFNRHNSWFNYLDLFTSYLKRCNFMLQQGTYVADVAYFIGEDVPKMTGVTDPPLPPGYAFDYINAEVIQNRLTVKNGRLYLPDGMNYGLLVLPKLETMRPELLAKIRQLVWQGATILGPRPTHSPSLQGYPAADEHVLRIASELWGDIDGVKNQVHSFGKGHVLYGMDTKTALKLLQIKPDYQALNQDSVLFIHRQAADADIYFISNQKNHAVNVPSAFRVSGKQPEQWNPVDGTFETLSHENKNGQTLATLNLDKSQSTFIVFRKSVAAGKVVSANGRREVMLATVDKPWKVVFDSTMRGPSQPVVFERLLDWTLYPDSQIKYYSGTAVYHNLVRLNKVITKQHIYLNLGAVNVIAKVKVNGVNVGGLWTPPWRLEITKAVKRGMNTVEISVANTWVNRLIGDSNLPLIERKTWTNHNPYRPNSVMQPSGLQGPVTITRAD